MIDRQKVGHVILSLPSIHSFITGGDVEGVINHQQLKICQRLKIRPGNQLEHVSWETLLPIRIDNQRIFPWMDGSALPPESLCALCYHDDRVYHLVVAEYEPHYYHRHHHHNHLQKRKCSSWNVPPIAPLDCCLSYGLVLLGGFTHLIPPSSLAVLLPLWYNQQKGC